MAEDHRHGRCEVLIAHNHVGVANAAGDKSNQNLVCSGLFQRGAFELKWLSWLPKNRGLYLQAMRKNLGQRCPPGKCWLIDLEF
jgi:hypothetical protein